MWMLMENTVVVNILKEGIYVAIKRSDVSYQHNCVDT